MHINPGGRLSPDEIVGRETDIGRYWNILDRQSLILTGERRIGKSHIMWKMHADGHDDFVTVYQDLEPVNSTAELVRAIYMAINSHLTKLQRLKAIAIGAWQDLAPKRIKDIDLPDVQKRWKSLVETAISDVASAIQDRRLVMMWDEFPLMIDNIQKREGPQHAMQLLDLLRTLRLTHKANIRFMFTGSIGLHIVLNALRKQGHTNAAVNDMYSETVAPMHAQATIDLATRLFETLDPQPDNPLELAKAAYALVGGFPYYIHHVADQLSLSGGNRTPQDVKQAVDRLILADNDPANLNYYVERIATYYDDADALLAYALLDTLAAESIGLPVRDLVNKTRHHHPEAAEQHVRGVVQLLRQDHYLTLREVNDDNTLSFRWSFVRRWWEKTRL